MDWRKVALTCLLLLAGSTACTSDGGDPSTRQASRTPIPSEAPSPEPASACAEEIVTAESETHPAQSSFMGDVDGDGEHDPISIKSFPRAEPGCRAVLTAFPGGAPISVSLEQEGVDVASGAPTLLGAADVDGRPGSEIIVRLVSGASTEFLGLYSAASGSLERLTVKGGEFGDLFPSGGSVGHLEQSDCAEPGTVVIATATPQGAKYLVRRAGFVWDGDAFSPDSNATTEEVVDADDLASGAVLGFASGAPFGSCPTD